MATIELNTQNFEAAVQRDGVVLVDWWAAWCAPCRMFAPIFEASSNEHPEIVYAKIDTEAQTELSSSFGIMSIPTLMAFRDGILLFNQAGALPASSLKQLIGQVLELDMDEVRREIAAAQASDTASTTTK